MAQPGLAGNRAACRKEAWRFGRGKVRGRAGMLISIRDIVD